MSPKILLTTCIGCALIGSAGAATTIGAGTATLSLAGANNTFDTPSDGTTDQSRGNLDDSFTANLAAGVYDASSFTFRAGQTGSVIPYLAILTAPDTYEVIAAGDQVDVAVGFDPSTDITVPFGGTSSFTLAADTVVFAGIVNPTGAGAQNPVFTNLASGSTVDHDNNADGNLSPAVVGGTVDGFGHANLARSYAFSVDVEVIPEPSGLVFGLLGGVLFVLRRRR